MENSSQKQHHEIDIFHYFSPKKLYENKAAQFPKNCYLKNILSTFSISMYILATEL